MIASCAKICRDFDLPLTENPNPTAIAHKTDAMSVNTPVFRLTQPKQATTDKPFEQSVITLCKILRIQWRMSAKTDVKTIRHFGTEISDLRA